MRKNSKCLPACSQTSYQIRSEYKEDLEKPDAKRNITFSFRFIGNTIKVEEEYLIHDFVGMLGSIGGTLGLFIGFSFLGGISFLLQQIHAFFENYSMQNMITDVIFKKDDPIKVVPTNECLFVKNVDYNLRTKIEQIEAKVSVVEAFTKMTEERVQVLEKTESMCKPKK